MTIVDFDRLDAWMDEQGLPRGLIRGVEELSGGTQNVLLRFQRGGESYVLRRPPIHKRANSDETMVREARVLAALASTDIPHPRLVAACTDLQVLGAAFYLMESVAGFNPNVALSGRYRDDPEWRWRLGMAMADGASAIASVDYEVLGLGDLGRAERYLERQVSRWRNQLESYREFREYAGAEIGNVDEVGEWLEANRPQTWRPGLIHGDYHLANVICAFDRPALAAIVDWELTTIGDPLVDLGWLLATWPDAGGPDPSAVGAEPWDGFPTEDQLVARYATGSDRDLSSVGWYKVLACYKLGIIVEGTYARALAGLAPMDIGERLHAKASALLQRAHLAIARS